MKTIIYTLLIITFVAAQDLNGFVEYALAPRIKSPGKNILDESRIQLNVTHESKNGELYFEVDLFHDNVLNSNTVSIGEAFFTTTPFDWLDLKIGRQIQTWGVGDFIFINDVFQKDWISFFTGRDDGDVKTPSGALRLTFFPESFGLEAIDLSIMPNSDSDINLQAEGRFQSVNPIYQTYASRGILFNQTVRTERSIRNSEFALRLKLNAIDGFTPTVYAYKGRWNNPNSFMFNGVNEITPYFAKLNVYGASLRGQTLGGILSLEAGVYDSRDDKDGTNPFIENSSFRYLALFETSLSTTVDIGIQFYSEKIVDYDKIKDGFDITIPENTFLDKDGLRDENRNLITVRLTKRMLNETLRFTWFSFYSPTDEDYYLRPRINYDYTDNIRFILTGNFFDAFGENDKVKTVNGLPDYHNTMFSQFKDDKNINFTFKYIF